MNLGDITLVVLDAGVNLQRIRNFCDTVDSVGRSIALGGDASLSEGKLWLA